MDRRPWIKLTCMNTEIADVRELIATYHRVFSSGDVDAVLELWDEEGVVFEPGSPAARGRDELRRAYERGYSQAAYRFDCNVGTVHVDGDLASALSDATGEVTVKATGQEVKVRARQLFTARRHPDGWKLLYYMFQEAVEGTA